MSDTQDSGKEEIVDVLNPLTVITEDAQLQALEQEVVDDLPAKFKGKTAKEIAQSALEAEKLIGKQGHELGELRKIVDGYLQSQLKPNTASDESKQEGQEKTTLDPKYDAGLRSIKKMETELKLRDAHPDFKQIVQDPEFAEWIGKSKVRTKLFQEADKEYDFDAADELFNNWKEIKTLRATKEADAKSEEERKAELKTAKAGSGAGAGGGSGGKKIYLRADLIKLRQFNPDKYNSMDAEIQLAYKEGRVR
jgi:hypothetical protein